MLIKQNFELQTQMKEQQNHNCDLQNQMLEVIKNGTTINNTNSHNKTFNLQFFLNETCKDAMNIMDFVDSIKLTLSDLEKVGKIGYVEGISNIITTNLKALDITQRPIHCTDTKREILYYSDREELLLFVNGYVPKKNEAHFKKQRVLCDPYWCRSVSEYLAYDCFIIDYKGEDNYSSCFI
jgi:hypothetical protein